MTGIDCVLTCPLSFWHVSCCLASPCFGLSLAVLAFSLFWPIHCHFGLSNAVLACSMLFWPVLCCFGLSLVILGLTLFWPVPCSFGPVPCHFGPLLVLACPLPFWACPMLFWPYVFMVFLPGCVPVVCSWFSCLVVCSWFSCIDKF